MFFNMIRRSPWSLPILSKKKMAQGLTYRQPDNVYDLVTSFHHYNP